jgi:hypothetical protein
VATEPQRYEVVVGLNYPTSDDPDVRREPGDVVDDIPKISVPWLLKDGLIRKTTKKLTTRKEA